MFNSAIEFKADSWPFYVIIAVIIVLVLVRVLPNKFLAVLTGVALDGILGEGEVLHLVSLALDEVLAAANKDEENAEEEKEESITMSKTTTVDEGDADESSSYEDSSE